MRTIIEAALKLRWVVLASAITLLVLGYQAILKSPLDVFPEFSPLVVEVQTESPGLSPLEVETLISTPLERILTGLPGMETIRSKSVEGLSSIILYFDQHQELLAVRQLVQERLLSLKGVIPTTVKAPLLLPPLSSLGRIHKIGVWSGTLSQTEMTTQVRWSVIPRLLSVPGVAHIALWGQRDKQIQVLIDSDKLRDEKVTLAEVVKAAQNAAVQPAGGFVDTPNQRLSLKQVVPITSAEDLKKVPLALRSGVPSSGVSSTGVASTGVPITIERVADVTEGHQQPIGDAVVNGRSGLLLIVEKQIGANTLQVTEAVEAALRQVTQNMNDMRFETKIFRPATFIEMSITNLKWALIWGCVLVAIILIAFLLEWRTAVISLTAIPLSLVMAVLVLYWNGVTLNTMIIAGLAIALGEVVDDAIIDVENVVRRLRLNALTAEPLPSWQVILDASLEVRSSVVYATIIVVLVFAPLFFLDGIIGTFFRPLALAYVLAVSASLLVALILTPALCLILLPQALTKESKELPILTTLRARYHAVLPSLFGRTKELLIGIALLFCLTGVITSQLGEAFMPEFKEYDFLMHWIGKPGTSIEATNRITRKVSEDITKIPGVEGFGAHIGRAEAADEVVGSNFAELWISISPFANYEATVAKVKAVIDSYPGIYHDMLTYLKERVEEVLSGGKGSIVIRLYGGALEELRTKAREVEGAISQVAGVHDLQVEPQVEIPQIEIVMKPQAATMFGITANDIQQTTQAMIHGIKVGEIHEDQRIVDITVWSQEKRRRNLRDVENLLIDTPSGLKIPLRDVAEVRMGMTPNIVVHENASRKIDISCNAKGRDLGSVVRDIEQQLKSVPLKPGYYHEILGEYEARQAGRNQLLALSALSLLGIFVILYIDFKSLRYAALVFFSLPFALIGGVFGALVTGGVLSMGSLVGFVTVLGIAARNGVMLLSHYRHLEAKEGMIFGPELILRGSQERLIPILMTAAATALALLPIALAGNEPGHEIEHPMAVVILGGLITSTILNLFVMPTLALRFAKLEVSSRLS